MYLIHLFVSVIDFLLLMKFKIQIRKNFFHYIINYFTIIFEWIMH